MAGEFEIKVKVKAESADSAKRISKVLKTLVKNISEKDLNTLADKIDGNPDFFKNLAPYLSML